MKIKRMLGRIREELFLPIFVRGKPKRDEKYYRNVFAYKGEFSTKEREDFFEDAYGEILFDLFQTWLQTTHDAVGEREYLFSVAMGLGSVNSKLQEYEMYGRNVRALEDAESEDEENDE